MKFYFTNCYLRLSFCLIKMCVYVCVSSDPTQSLYIGKFESSLKKAYRHLLDLLVTVAHWIGRRMFNLIIDFK